MKRNNVENGEFDIFELPLEIQADIISRLAVKAILVCRAISKAYNNFISTPYFTRLHHQNNLSTNSFTVFAQTSYEHPSLNLVELKNQKIVYQDTCIGPRSLPEDNDPCRHFSAWGNCNGLVCVLKLDDLLDVYNLFVTNPVYQDFIKLPQPIVMEANRYLAYGLGYCQRTDRYKVLRIITTHKTYERIDDKLVSKAEIFTVGFDGRWRTVRSVPYNLRRYRINSPNPQTEMVAVGSFLHWIVGPVDVHRGMGTIKPKTSFICDMTKEKVGKLPFPQGFNKECYNGCVRLDNCHLSVLSHKLCFIENINMGDLDRVINIWVMDEYGLAGSWRKHFMLPNDYSCPKTVPLSVGRALISDGKKLVFYDMNANKSQIVVDLIENRCFAFELSFVSLRNMITSGAIQCPEVLVVVSPDSLKYTKYKYTPVRYHIPNRNNN